MSPGPSVAESTWVEVFREQRTRLWRFFLRGAGTPESAEDLVQETLLRVWNHRSELGRDPGELRQAARRYLWRVARNLMIDEIRARQRERSRGADLPIDATAREPAAPNPGPAEAVELEQCLDVVRQTVERLPNVRVRRCLRLWLDGRSLIDIAATMKLGGGQVRGLLQRGKQETLKRAALVLGLADPTDRSSGGER